MSGCSFASAAVPLHTCVHACVLPRKIAFALFAVRHDENGDGAGDGALANICHDLCRCVYLHTCAWARSSARSPSGAVERLQVLREFERTWWGPWLIASAISGAANPKC